VRSGCALAALELHLQMHRKKLLGSSSFKAESDGRVHRANELLRGILTPVLRPKRACQ